LRLVVLGGEKVLKKDWEIYYQLFSDKCILVNAFGSTESSFNLLFLLDKNTKVNSVSVPIGYPLKDTEVTLVDPQGNPTDIVGEIAIKSPYIALGYWRKPELTKTFFMNNQQGNNKRIYLTGDWARRKADGTLVFLDRKDFLVKIRGFRIELGEVEAILNQHPAIKQTVVIVREDTPNKLYLAAYIIAHTRQPPNLGELRIYLQQKLPSYMIPNHFVFLDVFPKTPNNKIDRKSLPSPEQIIPEKPENFVAACGCLEGEITKIWQEVLEGKSLGTRDNFFELGGHSLLAVKLLAKLEKKLHRNYSLTTLFQSPTVEQMTLAIAQQEKSNPDPTIIPIQPYGSRPILFCIHILGRGLEFYRPLAKHLGLEYPLYGLNCQLMKPHNAKLNRVETLAAYYINSMRQLQPEGPYYLIGFSFGGKVAFEMAQQLVRQNLDVGFLGLVDSFPFPPARHSFLRRMAGHYKNTVESNGTYLVEKLREKIKGSYLNIKGIYRKILAKFFPSSTLALDPDLEDFMLQQENRLSQQQNRQASEKYILKPYPGRVTLFVAEDSFNGVFEVASDLGWSSLVQDGLDVYPVPGNHVSMLEDPNVEILAKNIQALFPQSGENNLP
jgi:aspartate racemase